MTSRRAFFKTGAGVATLFGLGATAGGRGALAAVSGYRYRQTFASGAGVVHALAVSATDEILVLGEGEIRRFGGDGHFLGALAVGNEARCVAADAQGRLFVGTADHVEIYRADGALEIRGPSLGAEVSLTSLALDGKGGLFASDGGQAVVWSLDGNLKLRHRIEREGGKFSVPHDIFPVASVGG
ncbi:MAG: hypothetical protein ACC661_09780, partial [Verrucomicrobiales bacterium]